MIHGHGAASSTQPLLCLLLSTMVLTGLPSCQCARPSPTASQDLIQQARQWRREQGMTAARDKLITSLGGLDAGRGYMEKRLWRTNSDKTFTYPDSLASLPQKVRRRTGIFFLMGLQSNAQESELVIRNVEAYLTKQGWHAHLVPVPMHGTTQEDAVIIQETLAKHLPHLDRAMIIGFSKGGLDWMYWFAEQGHQLPAKECAKIRLLVTFSGALRGSAVARWLTDAWGPVALSTRYFLRLCRKDGREMLADVKSIREDPWAGPHPPRMRALTPNLRMVSLVAIPEGPQGRTEVHPGFGILSFIASEHWRWIGPLDGMTETASQILPEQAGVPQHIVRVMGSHALLDGRYLNGGIVSKAFLKRDSAAWQGGEELLDDLMRALPSDWLQ